MKLKLIAFFLLNFLLLNNASNAAQIYAWSINSANLVAGKLFLNQTGTTSVTFTVDVSRASGETNIINPGFYLATEAADGTIQRLSNGYSVNDKDFSGTDLYGTQTETVTISNSDVINSTVYLAYTSPSTGAYVLFTGPYTVTNSSIPPVGAINWTGASKSIEYVTANSLLGVTTINTSSSPILTLGKAIFSAGHTTELVLQGDGNLVLYQVSNMKVLWASNTNNKGVANLYFQPTDGNLVLRSSSSSVIWASNIYASGGAVYDAQFAFYVLQDDGNFIMFEDSKYSYAPEPGNFLRLGDTGSSGFTTSPHFAVIN